MYNFTIFEYFILYTFNETVRNYMIYIPFYLLFDFFMYILYNTKQDR